MTTALNSTALDAALNGMTLDKISLHSGDPGVDGTGTVVKAAVACVFAAAADNGDGKRKRVLDAQVDITGATASTNVVNFGLWNDTTFMGYISRDSGDTATNAAGAYSITVATKIVIGNAA